MLSTKIFISSIALLLSVSSAIGSDNAFFGDYPNKPNECPQGDPSGSLITLPHESECDQFYVCIDGEKDLQECPEGLHFDSKQGICDWPSIANCQLTTTPRPWTTTTKKPITTTSVKPTTTQKPNPPSSTTTAKPTTTQKPNPPSTTTTAKPTTTQKPNPPSTTTTAKPTTTQKPNPPSSTTTAKPTTTQKPNPPSTTTTAKPTTTQKPNPPSSTTTAKPTTTQKPNPPSTTTTAKPTTTHKPNPPTTTTIRPTTTNKPNTTTTLRPTTTNKPNVTTTTLRPTTTNKPNITTTTLRPTTTTIKPGYPTTCPKDDSFDPILLPHECDCGKYYLCRNGYQILRECPKGLHFNPTIHDCDLPEDAGCLPSTPEPEPPVTPASDCPPVGSNGEAVHIAHETNCSLFYTCTYGGKVLQECPSGLQFNPKLQVCDWPWNVNCTNKPVSTTWHPTTTTQRITTSSRKPSTTSKRPITTTKKPIRCPWYDTKIPHEHDCSLYYKCVDGNPTLRRCYYGLHFNPWTKECDDPENVECIHKREAIYADADDVDNIIGSTPKPTTPSWQNPANCIGRCPIVDPIEYTVLLPNRHCIRYCACSGGRAIVIPCPVDLHFSVKLKVCTYPVDAKCRGIGGIIPSTSPAPPPTSSRRPSTGHPWTTSQKPIPSSSTKAPSTDKSTPSVSPPVTWKPEPIVKPADTPPSAFSRLFSFNL